MPRLKRMLITALKSILVVVCLSYTGLGFWLYTYQRSMIYQPTPEVSRPIYKAIYLEHDNTKLKIWRLHEGEEKGVVFFGGNADAVEHYLPLFDKIFPNICVYLVNYRGYGGSSGNVTERGLYSDALAVYDKIQPLHTSIEVIGRSLGTGIACYLASQRDVEKLILITPFDSVLHVAQNIFPIYPMSILLQDQYRSIDSVGSIKSKVLILIAGKDRTVPPIHAQTLALSFNQGQVVTRQWENANHNNILNQNGATETMAMFLDK